jgi:release factor glutamine methyltransferase
MRTVAEALAEAASRLASVTETPQLDAELLMAHALQLNRAKLLARLREPATRSDTFERWIERRLDHEPLAYIIGQWEFYGRTFVAKTPTLVPRPETEHLVEAVLEFCKNIASPRILEIGTGTGCVAITLACEALEARITATDIRIGNLVLARQNARMHEVESRVALLGADLFAPLRPNRGFDVICWNPPYVADSEWADLSPVITKHEDPQALLAGPEGLDAITRLVEQSAHHLRQGGLLAFEIAMGQDTAVRNLMKTHGFLSLDVRSDLAGIPRIAVGICP